MKYKLFPEKLYCSKDSPQFNFLLGWQIQLIEACLFLASDNINLSKVYFSKSFEYDFPSSNGNNLDKINYSEVFNGELAKKYGLIYKEMLLLWKGLQKENTALLNTTHSFSADLEKLHRNLLLLKRLNN